jgi:hypothetical protein
MSRPEYDQPSWSQADLEAGKFHDQLFHSHCQQCNHSGQDPNSDPDVALCASCKHLRLYHLLKCVLPSIDSAVRAIVIDLPRNKASKCDFCRLCFQLYCERLPDGKLEQQPGRYNELALSYHRHGDMLFIPELTFQRCYMSLCINDAVPQAHYYRGSKATMRNKDDTQEVYWPAICSQLHTSSQSNGEIVVPLGNNDQLVDVRVIDVDKCCVTDLPYQSEYAALSYVWGTHQEEQFQLTTLNLARLETAYSLSEEVLPRTIEDSMELCRRVGHKYLWVDRLCILQDAEPEHKTGQLDQMYAIYQQADFTVIALAGDASHGLPGISRPKSSRPRILAFENFAISERVPDISWLKSESEWNKRGWYVPPLS